MPYAFPYTAKELQSGNVLDYIQRKYPRAATPALLAEAEAEYKHLFGLNPPPFAGDQQAGYEFIREKFEALSMSTYKHGQAKI